MFRVAWCDKCHGEIYGRIHMNIVEYYLSSSPPSPPPSPLLPGSFHIVFGQIDIFGAGNAIHYNH